MGRAIHGQRRERIGFNAPDDGGEVAVKGGHFDVPWNPSRLEQRNGRIDRKLQPSEEVYCHYFVYTQRPEDRVLQALVRKTETIRRELGSLSQVLEGRVTDSLKGGIKHDDVDKLEKEIQEAIKEYCIKNNLPLPEENEIND